MLYLDEDTLLCGQLQGYLDLVRIKDGEVILSQDLRHVTGNIISMTKTYNRLNEVVLACQKGVFFCHIGKGNLGLTTKELKGLDYVESSREYEA